MRWGEALLAMLRPALITGPMLGGLGGVLIALAGMIYDGSTTAFYALFLFGFFGLILGLIIATPLCSASGAILLRMSAADERWLRRNRWLAIGTAAGALFGVAMGAFVAMGAVPSEWLVAAGLMVALFGFLGMLGAFVSHRLLRQRIARLNQVDAAVFG